MESTISVEPRRKSMVDKSVSTHAGAISHHSILFSGYTLEVTVFIAILVALVVGFALGRYKTHAFQNRGEARLSRALKRQFVAPDYHLLNHITLRLEDGTTQIDHVLVSRFGIFVIETKDYKGWIFAGPRDRYWTQVLYRAKFRFQNPLR
jgi:hypothetical protein